MKANAQRRNKPVKSARSNVWQAEALENRQLLAASVTTPLSDLGGVPGTSGQSGVFEDRFVSDQYNGTLVLLETTEGNVTVELFDQAFGNRTAAPITTANFLNYVNSGRYNNIVFHRSVPGFVVQTGGFTFTPTGNFIVGDVATDANIQNEFSATRSNVRGTLAMAKQGGDPNSANSQFFFNLADNSSNLNNQNGGFTSFARVLDRPGVVDGMAVIDTIAGFQRYNFGGAFSDLPLKNYLPEVGVNPNPITPPSSASDPTRENSIGITRASVIDDFEFQVTSSNPSIATAQLVTDENGLRRVQVNYVSEGTADITITGTNVLGETVSDTFGVTVGLGADVISEVTSFTPSTLLPGSKVTANIRLANVGTELVRGRSNLRLLLSTDSEPSSNDVVIRDSTTNINLRGGAARNLRARFVVPTDITPGNYRLLAVVDPAASLDELNRQNNVGISSTLGVQTPVVNLQPTFASPQVSLSAGRSGSVALNVTNTGNVQARGQVAFSFSIDRDNNGTRETVLATSNSNVTLKPGQTRRINLRLLVDQATQNFTGSITGQLTVVNGFNDANTTDNLFSVAGTIA